MTPNVVVVGNVSMPICCHIGSGMPYLHICVQEIVVKTILWSELEKKAMTRPRLQQNNIKANFIARELLVKRVVSFGVGLYHNH